MQLFSFGHGEHPQGCVPRYAFICAPVSTRWIVSLQEWRENPIELHATTGAKCGLGKAASGTLFWVLSNRARLLSGNYPIKPRPKAKQYHSPNLTSWRWLVRFQRLNAILEPAPTHMSVRRILHFLLTSASRRLTLPPNRFCEEQFSRLGDRSIPRRRTVVSWIEPKSARKKTSHSCPNKRSTR